MNVKEYLNQIYALGREIELDKDKLAAARSAACGGTVRYGGDGVKAATRKNCAEAAMLRAAELEERLDADIERLEFVRSSVEQAIGEIADPVFRELLTRRYLLSQKWEDIAEAMHYSDRHIRRLHIKALDDLIPFLILDIAG